MKNKQNGFTLLELMVTVAIVGIIASIAIWNSSDMLEENRAENFLLELKRSITYARSQAASTDEIVILCPAQEGAIKQANDEFECQQEWDTNKIIVVFVDADNNGSYNVANDALLRVIEDIPQLIALVIVVTRQVFVLILVVVLQQILETLSIALIMIMKITKL